MAERSSPNLDLAIIGRGNFIGVAGLAVVVVPTGHADRVVSVGVDDTTGRYRIQLGDGSTWDAGSLGLAEDWPVATIQPQPQPRVPASPWARRSRDA